jgi:MFS family permease
MQDVGEGWLMTSLTTSPLIVSLLQTSEGLAVFLLALPAGALADIVDRRRLLLWSQSWMFTVAALMTAITFAGLASPLILLVGGFAMGLGSALTAPSWQAIVPESVPREQLAPAVTLSGVAFNIARALGPALGGLVVAATGPATVFMLNALSFLAVITVLVRWRRPRTSNLLPAERVWTAVRIGLRFVRNVPELRAVLVRSTSFLFCACSVLALLPLIARRHASLGASGYGILLGCLGAGAVLGAVILSRLRGLLSVNGLVAIGAFVFSAGQLTLAWVEPAVVLAAAMFLCGVAWLINLSAFQVTLQTSLPPWVRGRALAVYLMASFGAIAVGSVVWGIFAGRTGLSAALSASAGGVVLLLLTTFARWPLRAAAEEATVIAKNFWPAPVISGKLEGERGPVLVTIEYRVDSGKELEFARAMADLGRSKRRSGAMRWGLFRDTAHPTRFFEHFLVESWDEHLRQHGRGTLADQQAEQRVRKILSTSLEPVVTHEVFEPLPHSTVEEGPADHGT